MTIYCFLSVTLPINLGWSKVTRVQCRHHSVYSLWVFMKNLSLASYRLLKSFYPKFCYDIKKNVKIRVLFKFKSNRGHTSPYVKLHCPRHPCSRATSFEKCCHKILHKHYRLFLGKCNLSEI